MGELSFTPGYRQLYEKIYGGRGSSIWDNLIFPITTHSLPLSLSHSLDMGAAPVPHAPSLSGATYEKN